MSKRGVFLNKHGRIGRNFKENRYEVDGENPCCGSLDSISLQEVHLGLAELREWIDHIDLLPLRVLKIFSFAFGADMFEYLVTRQFPSLEELEIGIMRCDDSPEPIRYGHTGHLFLLSLPPLTKLRVRDWKSAMCGVFICENFGSRLRQLSIFSNYASEILSLRVVQNLVLNCPLVEDLAIMIRRTRGDCREVAHYQSLGVLSKLRRLFLWLHCSDFMESTQDIEYSDTIHTLTIDHTLNKSDRQYVETKDAGRYCEPRARNGYVRDDLINSAIDQHLVYDIFRTICPGTGLLEYLEVKPNYGFTLKSSV